MKIIIEVLGGIVQDIIADEDCEIMVVDRDALKVGEYKSEGFERCEGEPKRFDEYLKEFSNRNKKNGK